MEQLNQTVDTKHRKETGGKAHVACSHRVHEMSDINRRNTFRIAYAAAEQARVRVADVLLGLVDLSETGLCFLAPPKHVFRTGDHIRGEIVLPEGNGQHVFVGRIVRLDDGDRVAVGFLPTQGPGLRVIMAEQRRRIRDGWDRMKGHRGEEAVPQVERTTPSKAQTETPEPATMNEPNRRQHYRIPYKVGERPVFQVGNVTFSVLDISETGIGFLPDGEHAFTMGAMVQGALLLPDGGEPNQVAGTVVRVGESSVAVKFFATAGIPLRIIMSEQRRLIRKRALR